MKILAMVNAHALAHVTRALEVAKVLRERGHTVLFGGCGRNLAVASADGFPCYQAEAVPEELMTHAIRNGRLDRLLPLTWVRRAIAAESRLCRELRPDLILVDDRATAITTAELLGIPTVSIANVHMTRYRSRPFYSPRDTFLSHWGGLCDRLERWENRIELFLFDRLVMKGLVRARKELSLPRRHDYELGEGDLLLLADIPEFNPVGALPHRARMVGPLTWKNNLPPPRCLESLDPNKRTVYFTMGSTGFLELADELGRLAVEDVQFIVPMGQDLTPGDQDSPPNVFVESFVNADLVLPHCDLVVCHGGNGTLYQALSHGVPVIGFPAHAEQAYGLKRIEEHGTGVALSRKEVEQHGIDCLPDVIRRVLADPGYRERAQSFARKLRTWNGPTLAADQVETFAAKRGLFREESSADMRLGGAHAA